jgi:hypothetical protein
MIEMMVMNIIHYCDDYDNERMRSSNKVKEASEAKLGHLACPELLIVSLRSYSMNDCRTRKQLTSAKIRMLGSSAL